MEKEVKMTLLLSGQETTLEIKNLCRVVVFVNSNELFKKYIETKGGQRLHFHYTNTTPH